MCMYTWCVYVCVCVILLNHLRLSCTFHDPKYFNTSPKNKNILLKNCNTITTFYKFDTHSVHFPNNVHYSNFLSDSLSNPGSCITFGDILLFIVTMLN